MTDLEAAAKRLYLHNVADCTNDRLAVEVVWDTHEDVRGFWLEQAKAAFGCD